MLATRYTGMYMDDQQSTNAPQPTPASPPPVSPQPTSVADVTRTPHVPTPPVAPSPVAAVTPMLPPQPEQPEMPVNPYQEQAERSASIADTMKTVFWGFINWVAAPLLIVFILHNFVFQAYHVDGGSMTPTLATADYMIVSKVQNSLSRIQGKSYIPKRHQIVVFNYPKDTSLIFIKRVIGLPGERIVVKGGKITIYNTGHPEGFSPDDGSFERASSYTEGDIDEVVPDGSIFVVGDNRQPGGSFDSREWGMLPSSDIIGDAVVRLLPLDGFRFFSMVVNR